MPGIPKSNSGSGWGGGAIDAGATTRGFTPAPPIPRDREENPVPVTLPPARFEVLVNDGVLLLRPDAQVVLPVIEAGVVAKEPGN